MTEWALLALSAVLIAACGVFVAGEFALLTVDRAAVERAAADGDRRAGGVLAALRSLSTQLSGVQVAITLTNLAVGFLSEPALAALLRVPLRGMGVAGSVVEVLAVAVALVVSTLLTMVFGELAPKNLALARPLGVARVVQAPIRAFTRAMGLPIRALNGLADGVLGVFGLESREELPSARSAEELLSLVRHSAREGTLAAGTATLLVRSLTFGDKHARDVLTPRPRMTTVPATASITELLAVIHASGHSRLPVLGGGGLDDVRGIVELDRAVAVPPDRRSRSTVVEVMDRTVEVPDTLALDGVLRALQTNRAQLAMVIDEYGGTAGLLTGEDLLEELVGEVDDEHDEPVSPTRRVAGGFEVSGLLRPDEVAAATGLRLPARGGYDTVGGLIMHELGRIPVEGDRIEIEGISITVQHMDQRRVERVVIAAADDEAGAR